LVARQMVEVFPAVEAAVMAVAEGQFQRVLPGGLHAFQRAVDLAGLQHRVAVALDLGGGRMYPQELGRQAVALVGAVLQFQGFRGLAEFYLSGDAHEKNRKEAGGWEAERRTLFRPASSLFTG